MGRETKEGISLQGGKEHSSIYPSLFHVCASGIRVPRPGVRLHPFFKYWGILEDAEHQAEERELFLSGLHSSTMTVKPPLSEGRLPHFNFTTARENTIALQVYRKGNPYLPRKPKNSLTGLEPEKQSASHLLDPKKTPFLHAILAERQNPAFPGNL